MCIRDRLLPPPGDDEANDDPDMDANAVEADRARLLDVLNAPLSRTMVGVGSAGALPLPHQQLIAVRAVETFPRGYPVSYTHLDVYKRQVEHDCCDPRRRWRSLAPRS